MDESRITACPACGGMADVPINYVHASGSLSPIDSEEGIPICREGCTELEVRDAQRRQKDGP
jgi:hypothetical protein